MKYMGSKRWMLGNGLGDLIAREAEGATRFVDLFSGSAVVATHVAIRYQIPVFAYDLQTFSQVAAQAVLGRVGPVDAQKIWERWYVRARGIRRRVRPPSAVNVTRAIVEGHRRWSSEQAGGLTRAYGGYYFSALQSSWLDALHQALPDREPARTVAVAALVRAASECAAAPGHTAQPFQPTRTAKPFLLDAWHRDIVDHCSNALFEISKQYAKVRGHAEVGDANEAARFLVKGDLAFVDPPYSGVHYSRFYHVLESIARGKCGHVSGRGRYPAPEERPRSKYSITSESSAALADLFETIAAKGARAIVTFPLRNCSNGLSGRIVANLARAYFDIEQHWVASRFSTLGGNNQHRYARRSTRELILVLNA